MRNIIFFHYIRSYREFSISRANESTRDEQTRARIQIEFDTFVLRSSNIIYLSRCLGAWQYLAILPFAELRTETLWKLYYLLITGFDRSSIEDVDNDYEAIVMLSNILEKFNDTIIDVPAEDLYYLMQTLSSMAMARSEKDFKFIHRVTIDLFKASSIEKKKTIRNK